MAEINIKADHFTSNHDALMAVAEWMKENKEKGYKRIRFVTIDGDKEFNVAEKIRHDELTSCNGDFIVTARISER